VALGALLSAGCAPLPDGVPTVTSPASSQPVTPTPTSTPTGPALVPDGTAQDNLPVFTEVMQTVAATADKAKGRAYIDALVIAGFDKSAMEVTNDRTTVDDPADSIQFSVKWGEECLVGQVGPSTTVPTAVVLPVLPGGQCLIGQTRPIDW
jgi:hypothetical protein